MNQSTFLTRCYTGARFPPETSFDMGSNIETTVVNGLEPRYTWEIELA